MYVSFATCDKRDALRFLKALYPSCTVDESQPETAALLDLVGKDIVRIQDPSMHKPANIMPGTHYATMPADEIHAIALAFHKAVNATQAVQA